MKPRKNSNNSNNNNNNNDENIPLLNYVARNQLSLYFNLIIARNIAIAVKKYGETNGYGNILLHNMTINQDTLEVTVQSGIDKKIRIPYFGDIDGSLLYSASEKLNNNLQLTEKSDVYSIMTIIIDIMTCTSPYQSLEYNEFPAYYKNRVENNPIFLKDLVNPTFNRKLYDTDLLKQFFGKNTDLTSDEIKKHPIKNQTIKEIELCRASAKRFNLFIEKLDAWISDDVMKSEKNNLQDICLHSLAIKQDLRPTQEQLIEVLTKVLDAYMAEFYIKPCLILILEKDNKIKRIIDKNLLQDFEFFDTRLASTKNELWVLADKFFKEPIVTERTVKKLKEIVENAYDVFENKINNIIDFYKLIFSRDEEIKNKISLDELPVIAKELDEKKMALYKMAEEIFKKTIITKVEVSKFSEIITNAYNELENNINGILYISNNENKLKLLEKASTDLEHDIILQQREDDKKTSEIIVHPGEVYLSELNENDDVIMNSKEDHQIPQYFSVQPIRNSFSFLANKSNQKIIIEEIKGLPAKSQQSIQAFKKNITLFDKQHKKKIKQVSKSINQLEQAINNVPPIKGMKFSKLDELDKDIDNTLVTNDNDIDKTPVANNRQPNM